MPSGKGLPKRSIRTVPRLAVQTPAAARGFSLLHGIINAVASNRLRGVGVEPIRIRRAMWIANALDNAEGTARADQCLLELYLAIDIGLVFTKKLGISAQETVVLDRWTRRRPAVSFDTRFPSQNRLHVPEAH